VATKDLHRSLSWSTSIQFLPLPYFFFNIFLPSTSWFSKLSATHQNPVCPFPLTICAISFAHPNVLDLIALIFVEVKDPYAVSSSHISSRAKCLLQHPILEHPHLVFFHPCAVIALVMVCGLYSGFAFNTNGLRSTAGSTPA